MRYWTHWHNVRYEIGKWLDMRLLDLARHLPGRLRAWVVIDASNVAVFQLYPRKDGYAGPDGLTFEQIYDGARRRSSRP